MEDIPRELLDLRKKLDVCSGSSQTNINFVFAKAKAAFAKNANMAADVLGFSDLKALEQYKIDIEKKRLQLLFKELIITDDSNPKKSMLRWEITSAIQKGIISEAELKQGLQAEQTN